MQCVECGLWSHDMTAPTNKNRRIYSNLVVAGNLFRTFSICARKLSFYLFSAFAPFVFPSNKNENKKLVRPKLNEFSIFYFSVHFGNNDDADTISISISSRTMDPHLQYLIIISIASGLLACLLVRQFGFCLVAICDLILQKINSQTHILVDTVRYLITAA